MSEQKAGSFNTDDHSEGGFFDDKDCTIVKAQIVEFDYQGKSDAVCALAVQLRPDGSDGDQDDRTEYYRIGDLSKFTPSADRQFYVPVGSATNMNKNSKASLFLKALKEAGFPLSKLANGIGGMDGLHVHVNIVPMPEMKGVDRTGKKELTILVVTKLLDAPAEGGKAAGKPKAAGKAKAAASEQPAAAAASNSTAAAGSSVEGAEDRATEIILGLLAEKGGKINKANVPAAMFAQIPASEAKLRNAAIALSSNPAWMGAAERPWQYAGGEISLG